MKSKLTSAIILTLGLLLLSTLPAATSHAQDFQGAEIILFDCDGFEIGINLAPGISVPVVIDFQFQLARTNPPGPAVSFSGTLTQTQDTQFTSFSWGDFLPDINPPGETYVLSDGTLATGDYDIPTVDVPGFGRTAGTVKFAGSSITFPLHFSDAPITCVGEPPPCSIGDYVWEDADRDGCQDDDEREIAGVVVTLYEDCDNLSNPLTTTTNADGFYEFLGLDCDKGYIVEFGDAGDIYARTSKDSCSDFPADEKDSDCDQMTGRTGCIEFTPGGPTENPTIDCGYVCEGVIGDRVWLDTNGNVGCQDLDEGGIDQVTVNLFEVGGCPDVDGQTPDRTFDTVNGGKYSFTGLCPGDYRVTFDIVPQDRTVDNAACDDPNLIGGGGDGSDSDCGSEDECVTLTVGNPVDLTIDCGKVPPCELAVEKFCTEPPTAVLECTDQIVATTLRYIGPDMANATVEVDPDKGPTVVYSNVDLVSGVTILTMPAENDFTVDARPDENELGSKTKIRINGVEEVIHTSCSTPYAAGLPAPLDNPKGDPSPNWFVENFEDKDGNFSAVTDPVLKEECEVFTVKPGSCADGKAEKLIMEYLGGTCPSDLSAGNTQDPGKVKCEDKATIAVDPVYILAGDKDNPFDSSAGKFFQGFVSVGELFSIDATLAGKDELGGDTRVHILDSPGGTPLQFIKFHTSCSQPLNVGDVFGTLKLEQFIPKGSTLVTENVVFTYQINNNGGTPVTVDVVDDQIGPIAEDLEIPAGEQFELTKGALLTETTTNTVKVTDVDDNDCFATDSVTVTVKEPPTPPCTTKVQAMKLKYTGSTSLTNVEFDPDKGASVTYATVNPGDTLSMPVQNDWTIDATVSGEEELGAKTKIFVNSVLTEIIHTSCSTPFAAGAPAPLDGGSPGVPGNPDPDKGDPSPNWFVEDFVQK